MWFTNIAQRGPAFKRAGATRARARSPRIGPAG
jgi:hypothetical protein